MWLSNIELNSQPVFWFDYSNHQWVIPCQLVFVTQYLRLCSILIFKNNLCLFQKKIFFENWLKFEVRDCTKRAHVKVNDAEQIPWKSSLNFKSKLFSLYSFNCYDILKIGCLVYLFLTHEEKSQKSMHLPQFEGKENGWYSKSIMHNQIFEL